MKRILALTDVLLSMMDGDAGGDSAAALAEADADGQVRIRTSTHDIATAIEKASKGGVGKASILSEWGDFFMGLEVVEVNTATLAEAWNGCADLGLDPHLALSRAVDENSLVDAIVGNEW